MGSNFGLFFSKSFKVSFVVEKTLTAGQFSSFLMYMIIIIASLIGISNFKTDRAIFIASKNRISEILALECEKNEGFIPQNINIDTEILPIDGLNDDTIQQYIDTIKESDTKYKLISGCIYDDTNNQHANIMMRSYEQFAYSNPMHGDIYNSVVFMERNMISMIGHLLQHPNPCGTITNGGTESLFLAIKTLYRGA